MAKEKAIKRKSVAINIVKSKEVIYKYWMMYLANHYVISFDLFY